MFFHQKQKGGFGKTPHNAGFTLLLAALVASLALTLGLAIVSIARKSVTLSSIGRDSQFAFYAADTAAECALYWDVRFSRFPTTTPYSAATVTCDAQTESLSITGTGPIVSTFEYEPNGHCARVTVTKNSSHPHTVIRGDGFSTSCDTLSTNPRALQRSVELRY